jgi:hypothetical protein
MGRRHRVAPLAIGVALAAAPAGAQLPDTDLMVRAEAGGEIESHQLFGANIGSADSDYAVTFGDGSSWSGVAHALAGGGGNTLDDPPTADVTVDVTVSEVGETSVLGSASANAHYFFYARVNQTAPPPIGYNPPVMVRVTYHGETTITGDAEFSTNERSQAAAYFSIRDDFLATNHVAEQAASLQGQLLDDFGATYTFTLSPGEVGNPLHVYVRADASLYVRGSGTAHAHAIADPVFELDQAAFDEYAAFAGFETFPLDQYYGLEFSEAFAPEPAGGAQAIAAIAALWLVSGAGRRRRVAAASGRRARAAPSPRPSAPRAAARTDRGGPALRASRRCRRGRRCPARGGSSRSA